MSNKKSSVFVLILLATLVGSFSGCAYPLNTTCGPQTGLWLFPIPVSPYFQKQLEDRFRNKERYERVAILGPITAGVRAEVVGISFDR